MIDFSENDPRYVRAVVKTRARTKPHIMKFKNEWICFYGDHVSTDLRYAGDLFVALMNYSQK